MEKTFQGNDRNTDGYAAEGYIGLLASSFESMPVI